MIGLRCVAGPVYDDRNRMVAAVSASGASAEFSEDSLPELIGAVRCAGEAISKRLGHHVGDDRIGADTHRREDVGNPLPGFALGFLGLRRHARRQQQDRRGGENKERNAKREACAHARTLRIRGARAVEAAQEVGQGSMEFTVC